MPEEHSKATLDAKMRQVRASLALADHPNTPADEAANARAFAERLMMKYRLEEEMLIKSGDLKTDVISVQSHFIDITPVDSEFSGVYSMLMSYACNHTGCFAVTKYDWERRVHVAHVFGYEADIRYAEALFTAARLFFADRMEPKPDLDMSDEDNVYRMRSAGMERIRIAAIMGFGTTTSATAKVTRLYKKACAARDENPTLTGKGNNVKNFREVYKDEFTSEFYWRLFEARQAVEAEMEGSGLVLADRPGRIKEAMWTEYPNLRPKDRKSDPWVDDRTEAQRRRDDARAQKDALKRASKRYSAAGRAGAEAGRAAAREVDIKGQTPKRRLDNN